MVFSFVANFYGRNFVVTCDFLRQRCLKNDRPILHIYLYALLARGNLE